MGNLFQLRIIKRFTLRSDIMLGVVTVAMAILGGVVSVHAPSKRRLKVIYASAFMVLGGISVVYIIKQSNENAAAGTNLTGALAKLGSSTAEISRMTALNTQLQGRLLSQSDTISGLAQRSVNSVIGGRGFCYLTLYSRNSDTGDFLLLQQGDYPIYEIHIRAVDITSLNEITKKGGSSAVVQAMESFTTSFDIPTMAPHTATMNVFRLPIRHADKQDFNVFFSARNGFWSELIRLRKVNGAWTQAIRAARDFTDVKVERHSLPWTHIEPQYPKPVEW
jgi:hypothetical protein